MAVAALSSAIAACDPGDVTPRAGATPVARAPVANTPSAMGAATSAASAPTPDEAAGQALYTKYCALCHGPEAKGYAADNAPSLVSETFLRSATDEFLSMGISMGRPGTPMAPYGARFGGPLADEQIRQIVAFLRARGPKAQTLAAVAKGDAEAGKPLFAALCAECHADDPKRIGPRLDLPSFLHIATDSFLDYAIRMGRPGTKMEPFQDRLTPAQISDVIAYLRTFQNPAPPSLLPEPTGKEPIVVHPKGKHAKFTLREDRFVPAADVAAALAAKRRLVILDARASSDWRLGHIPGAISMPYYEMKRLDEIPRDGTWVLAYCACPHHASGEVVDELRRRGYPKTAVIDEGITFWRNTGYPMALPPPAEGTKAASPAPGKANKVGAGKASAGKVGAGQAGAAKPGAAKAGAGVK